MSVIELLPRGISYYKANLHCHTTLSDGLLTPEEVKELYREKGYSIVAFTDHRKYVYHKELCDENFVAIAAMEADINESGNPEQGFDRLKTYHINLYDMNPEVKGEEKRKLTQPEMCCYDMEHINEYVDRMKGLGFLACYNHPYWSLQTYDDYKDLKGFWGMEIYNHGCEMEGLYGYHPQAYDEMLRSGQRLFAVAADDNHNRFPVGNPLCDSLGGAVMVGTEKLTCQAVMEALEKGHFYSTISPAGEARGLEIEELYIEDGVLHIQCSPADRICVKTMGRRCYVAAAAFGETITQAQFRLDGSEGYIRVSIQDACGRRAESNAYFID